MKKSLTVGSIIPKLLVSAGVKHVFGFPGETSLPFYMGMQNTTGIQHVLARCPRCAAYMAESYARISGNLGICDAPGGIGSPFATPALHEAFNSSTPLLFIASGVSRNKRNRWTTSQCDQQNLFKAVTKATYLLNDVNDLPIMLNDAIQTAVTPRTGPVFLELPADVLLSTYDNASAITAVSYPFIRIQPDSNQIINAAEIIRHAKSPVIIAGGGVFLSKATAILQELVSHTRIPVATTLNGKGSLNEKNKISLGVTGAKGNIEVNEWVENSDCLIVLGSKLGDKSTNSFSWPKPHQSTIHVDVDEHELCKLKSQNYLPIKSDIYEFLVELKHLLGKWSCPALRCLEKKIYWEQGLTHHLCESLNRWLPEGAIVVADASVASGWAGAALRLSATQRLINPRGSGSIGYALPAAIGAAFAKPHTKIFAIGGDGGLSIAMHEMETAARYHLPIVYFLLNNTRLGLIDKHATAILHGKPISDQFIDLNWNHIAQAFKWKSYQVTSESELNNIIPTIFSYNGPMLIDCKISPEEMAPDFFITLTHVKKQEVTL